MKEIQQLQQGEIIDLIGIGDLQTDLARQKKLQQQRIAKRNLQTKMKSNELQVDTLWGRPVGQQNQPPTQAAINRQQGQAATNRQQKTKQQQPNMLDFSAWDKAQHEQKQKAQKTQKGFDDLVAQRTPVANKSLDQVQNKAAVNKNATTALTTQQLSQIFQN